MEKKRKAPKRVGSTVFWGVVSCKSGHPCLYSLSYKSGASALKKHRKMTKHQGGAVGGEIVRKYKTLMLEEVKA